MGSHKREDLEEQERLRSSRYSGSAQASKRKATVCNGKSLNATNKVKVIKKRRKRGGNHGHERRTYSRK
jgi:hypothetical protein